MREIKFIAWDKDSNSIVEVPNTVSYDSLFDNPQYIPMQFTGLLDKNGKEIYEGDIVKRTYEFTKSGKPKEDICDIVYRDDWGAFAFHKKSNIGNHFSHLWSGHKVYPFEVIGNIYENPELVK